MVTRFSNIVDCSSSKKAIFLDRDGVIVQSYQENGKPIPARKLSDFIILDGVAQALIRFKQAGFYTLVVTNQPDLAKGLLDIKVLLAMNNIMLSTLALDNIYVCKCLEGPSCDCYKPKPGMLLEAAGDYSLSLEECFMIGDRWRDIDAGKNVGCQTVFIDRGYNEKAPTDPDFTAKSLLSAADILLR